MLLKTVGVSLPRNPGWICWGERLGDAGAQASIYKQLSSERSCVFIVVHLTLFPQGAFLGMTLLSQECTRRAAWCIRQLLGMSSPGTRRCPGCLLHSGDPVGVAAAGAGCPEKGGGGETGVGQGNMNVANTGGWRRGKEGGPALRARGGSSRPILTASGCW